MFNKSLFKEWMDPEQRYSWDPYRGREAMCPAGQEAARLGDDGDQGLCLVVSMNTWLVAEEEDRNWATDFCVFGLSHGAWPGLGRRPQVLPTWHPAL